MIDKLIRQRERERAQYIRARLDAGVPSALGSPPLQPAEVARPAGGGSARFSVEDFHELADKFRQAATMLMIAKTQTEGDDDLIARFVRYAAMCKQAAESERTR